MGTNQWTMGWKVKGRLKNFIMWGVVALIVILSFLNIYLTLYTSNEQSKTVEEKIQLIRSLIDKEPALIQGIKGNDGYSPVKGIDYFDGKDGKDGEKGEQGNPGIDGKDGERGLQGIQGEKGDKGADAYIELRCNLSKNRWEVKYNPDDSWKLLNGKSVKCTVDNVFNIIVE